MRTHCEGGIKIIRGTPREPVDRADRKFKMSLGVTILISGKIDFKPKD